MTQTSTPSPVDFSPFRKEIGGCYCAEYCVPIAHLISLDSGRHAGGAEHLALAAGLLAALRGGTHTRRTRADYVASLPAYEGKGWVACHL